MWNDSAWEYSYDITVFTGKGSGYRYKNIEADNNFDAIRVVCEFFIDDYPNEDIMEITINSKTKL